MLTCLARRAPLSFFPLRLAQGAQGQALIALQESLTQLQAFMSNAERLGASPAIIIASLYKICELEAGKSPLDDLSGAVLDTTAGRYMHTFQLQHALEVGIAARNDDGGSRDDRNSRSGRSGRDDRSRHNRPDRGRGSAPFRQSSPRPRSRSPRRSGNGRRSPARHGRSHRSPSRQGRSRSPRRSRSPVKNDRSRRSPTRQERSRSPARHNSAQRAPQTAPARAGSRTVTRPNADSTSQPVSLTALGAISAADRAQIVLCMDFNASKGCNRNNCKFYHVCSTCVDIASVNISKCGHSRQNCDK